MAAETQYTANTGMVTISTANSNLDGTGTLGTVLTGASLGTLIKTVRIKAQGNTTHGMVRLFVYDGSSTKLITEVEVPAVTKSGTYPAYEAFVPINYILESGGILKASTQNAETFNVIAEGMDYAYYGTVRPDSTKYAANTGIAVITTANTALDGTGTLNTNIWDVLTAASSGTTIQSVTVKAIVSTTAGMVRLFIYDGTNTKLLTEIKVDAVTKSAVAHSYSQRIDFNGIDFVLKSGWKLRATTQNSETFNVIAEGLDWTYPA